MIGANGRTLVPIIDRGHSGGLSQIPVSRAMSDDQSLPANQHHAVDIAQRKQKSVIHWHAKLDELGRGLEAAE